MSKSNTSHSLPLRVGAARITEQGTIRFAKYKSGETAIEIIGDDGEQETVATVSLVPYGAPNPGPFGLWLKGWSENEGLPEALVAAGIVTLTGRTFRCGFDMAEHAELTDIARAARDLSRHC
jgi:hypothetical protein